MPLVMYVRTSHAQWSSDGGGGGRGGGGGGGRVGGGGGGGGSSGEERDAAKGEEDGGGGGGLKAGTKWQAWMKLCREDDKVAPAIASFVIMNLVIFVGIAGEVVPSTESKLLELMLTHDGMKHPHSVTALPRSRGAAASDR